jgi:hypothetical protein
VSCRAAAVESVCLQRRKLDLSSTTIVSEHRVMMADPKLPPGFVLVTEVGVGLGAHNEDGTVVINKELRWKDVTLNKDEEKKLAIADFVISFNTVPERDAFYEMLKMMKGTQVSERAKSRGAIRRIVKN